ncbi:hypothetical protein [Desulfobotulus mexicanus]|uniref:Uncharacterized protein n=1 Tax=Desulfobotulus mexicanus TaxID=2586642 RepID=A0A5S5MC08_9BACT|nr:hypothetical protein [Desulfobotulus mexicanus]TYT73155.1 hypothetical protein FIM25_16605 [Desulfobotulus mexicanus]
MLIKNLTLTLYLSDLEAEFNSVQETIADLSLISFELVKDCHWGDLDMTLYIYGAGDPETEYPVYEARIDTEFFLAEGSFGRVVSCKKLVALFSCSLVEEICRRNIPVVCNRGDSTETYIDLENPGEGVLLPMLR